jgi:taspase (threonine aspartase 1)
LTNAGVGSNLNIKGSVECDAAIMEGKQLMYGAVGAISGETNIIYRMHFIKIVLQAM